MKKLIISLLALMSVAVAGAQFRYGPMIGGDVTSLSFKQDLFKVDQSVGFSAGVAAEMMFPGIGFGIDMGLFYEQRGATLHLGDKLIWSSQGYGVNRTYLHYLQLPIHLRFKWTRMNGFEDYLAPFVFAGPDFSFLVGHSHIRALDYAGGDVGITVGLGVEIWKHWQVSASHTWGMTYALKTALLTNMSARNNTWDLRMVYLF